MSLFHYVTYKYIIIKDKRLGVAYYCLATLIVIYTLVQIVVNKAYLQFDKSPRGNVRIIVNVPPQSHVEPTSVPSYCCSTNSSTCSFCQALDGLALTWPVESKAVTIATYVKEKWEERHSANERFNIKRLTSKLGIFGYHILQQAMEMKYIEKNDLNKMDLSGSSTIYLSSGTCAAVE